MYIDLVMKDGAAMVEKTGTMSGISVPARCNPLKQVPTGTQAQRQSVRFVPTSHE